jgi:hypothetical protein
VDQNAKLCLCSYTWQDRLLCFDRLLLLRVLMVAFMLFACSLPWSRLCFHSAGT